MGESLSPDHGDSIVDDFYLPEEDDELLRALRSIPARPPSERKIIAAPPLTTPNGLDFDPDEPVEVHDDSPPPGVQNIATRLRPIFPSRENRPRHKALHREDPVRVPPASLIEFLNENPQLARVGIRVNEDIISALEWVLKPPRPAKLSAAFDQRNSNTLLLPLRGADFSFETIGPDEPRLATVPPVDVQRPPPRVVAAAAAGFTAPPPRRIDTTVPTSQTDGVPSSPQVNTIEPGGFGFFSGGGGLPLSEALQSFVRKEDDTLSDIFPDLRADFSTSVRTTRKKKKDLLANKVSISEEPPRIVLQKLGTHQFPYRVPGLILRFSSRRIKLSRVRRPPICASSVYSLSEDFFFFEKLAEFQSKSEEDPGLTKIKFVESFSSMTARSYYAIRKRLDRLAATSAKFRFVFFFFCLKFRELSGKRKIEGTNRFGVESLYPDYPVSREEIEYITWVSEAFDKNIEEDLRCLKTIANDFPSSALQPADRKLESDELLFSFYFVDFVRNSFDREELNRAEISKIEKLVNGLKNPKEFEPLSLLRKRDSPSNDSSLRILSLPIRLSPHSIQAINRLAAELEAKTGLPVDDVFERLGLSIEQNA